MRNFLSAISSLTPEFAAIWSREAKPAQAQAQAQAPQAQNVQTTELDLFDVIEEYRDYRRQFGERGQSFKSAFSTAQQT